MKKILALLLSLMLMLSFASCNDAAQSTGGGTTNNNVQQSSDDTDWKEFLADYEAWVDDYIELVKKYKENPADMSILSDYNEMIAELSEWTERADEVQADLENSSPAEVSKYAAELAKITAKLAKIG